jgi:hypothetical protein
MRILIVAWSYEIHQNGAVSNELTDGDGGGGGRVTEGVHCTLYVHVPGTCTFNLNV